MSHPLAAFFSESPIRARVPAEKRRTERIHVLVSPEERLLLEDMARDRHCSISTLLRSSIDTIPPPALTRDGLQVLHSIHARLTVLLREVMGGNAASEAILHATLSIHDQCTALVEELNDRHSNPVR